AFLNPLASLNSTISLHDALPICLAQRRLTLDGQPAARDWLALNGYDPVYGARPLRRLVQSAIGDQLAKKLLSGEIKEGDKVVVDVTDDNDKLTVEPAS